MATRQRKQPVDTQSDAATDFNPAELEATPATNGELLDTNNAAMQVVNSVADSTRLPDDEDAAKAQYPSSRMTATVTEPVRRADPFGRHSVQWEDGYQITLQESDSRNTIELQFGDGSREAQPKAFAEIKTRLKAEGFRWNGTNAWTMELAPVLGSQNDRLRARDENHRIRARVEDVVFPAVIAMEEAVRGEIPFTDETRERINKGAAVQTR